MLWRGPVRAVSAGDGPPRVSAAPQRRRRTAAAVHADAGLSDHRRAHAGHAAAPDRRGAGALRTIFAGAAAGWPAHGAAAAGSANRAALPAPAVGHGRARPAPGGPAPAGARGTAGASPEPASAAAPAPDPPGAADCRQRRAARALARIAAVRAHRRPEARHRRDPGGPGQTPSHAASAARGCGLRQDAGGSGDRAAGGRGRLAGGHHGADRAAGRAAFSKLLPLAAAAGHRSGVAGRAPWRTRAGEHPGGHRIRPRAAGGGHARAVPGRCALCALRVWW